MISAKIGDIRQTKLSRHKAQCAIVNSRIELLNVRRTALFSELEDALIPTAESFSEESQFLDKYNLGTSDQQKSIERKYAERSDAKQDENVEQEFVCTDDDDSQRSAKHSWPHQEIMGHQTLNDTDSGRATLAGQQEPGGIRSKTLEGHENPEFGPSLAKIENLRTDIADIDQQLKIDRLELSQLRNSYAVNVAQRLERYIEHRVHRCTRGGRRSGCRIPTN